MEPPGEGPRVPGADRARLLLRRQWLDIPLGRRGGRRGPTWGVIAERFDRCLGRLAFYVGKRVDDRGRVERIVTEVLEANLRLLVAEHDELEELRRLRAAADRRIATSGEARPGALRSRPPATPGAARILSFRSPLS
jgi:hypothetical protein